ncbi:MAG: hypothetical protein IKA76_09545 [Clostridia bacterium]|nr:hypothetical protein [Clostridia bacterium]
MRISYDHESIRLTGRWDVSKKEYAETTTTGAYLEFAFEGDMAIVRFDITTNATPLLHLWIEVDGGVRVEAPIDRYLRIKAPTVGKHICRVIYKGGTENDRRWYHPLTGKVSFIGIDVEKPLPIGEDTRKVIEFVGDSITEGVLVDDDYCGDGEKVFYIDMLNRIYQDDVCATYAWLTAERLNLRPVFMGYGAVGIGQVGMGRVPAVVDSYPYNFENSPVTRPCPDIVMINHGANDRKRETEEYLAGYEKLLDTIRAMNPKAKIVSLSAFCGAHHEALASFIPAYNLKNGTSVAYIDSNGWIPVSPLHPLRDGHKTVAEHLIPILKEILEN